MVDVNLICEYCQNKIEKKYASGRFCNEKCARGYSTKAKRVEINQKIRKYKILQEGDLQQVKTAIENSLTMREAARAIGVKPSTFIRFAKKYEIYKPNPGSKGKHILVAEDILKMLDKPANNDGTKKILFRNNLKPHCCEECGIAPIWCGKPISLELDHINGNRKDNRLENLRILCPNCHSQTSTFRRKKSSLFGDVV